MTPGIGYEQLYNGNAPWLKQKSMVVPDFSTMWSGGWNSGGWSETWNTGWGSSWGSTTSSSTTSSIDYSKRKDESFDEYKERIYKEEKTRSQTRKELRKQLNEAQAAEKETKNAIETLNKGKKDDGSAEILPDFKKMTFMDKALRTVDNGFKCVKNVAKSIAGFDKDGKWDPKKCLRNVAVIVGVGALCAFAGPIGAAVGAKVGGLLMAAGVSATTAATATTVVATSIAATPTVLRVVGLASGATLTTKGAIGTYYADTLEEFDTATQELGQGILITGASLVGGKTKTNTTTQATNALPSPSSTTSSTGLWSSIKNYISKPFKNAWNSAYTSQSNARAIMDANGGGWQGFKAACKDVRLAPTREAKEQFEQQRNDIYQKFLDKYNKLAEQHRTSNDPIEKIIIDLKGKGLHNQANKLYNASNKTDFRLLKNASKDYIAELKGYLKALKKNGEVEINGKKFTTADKTVLKQAIKDVIKEQKSIMDDISGLTKSRFDSMLKMSRTKVYRSEANDFGFSGRWYSRPWEWLQATYFKGVKKGDVFNVGMTALDPVWFTQPYFKNPALMPLNAVACVSPTLDKSSGEIINAEEFKKQMAELETQRSQIEPLIAQLENQIDATYA